MQVSRRSSQLVVLVAIAVGAASLGVGCEPARGAREPTELQGLAVWEGRAQELFDDNIDPSAVGLAMEGPAPRSDPHLRERAQTAELVARVRVNTVTVRSTGDESRYHIGVQVGLPTLVSTKLEEREFELLINPTSQAYGVARTFDARLRGMTFIGFLRRFVGQDGEPVLRWHLSPDTAEVAAAIKDAVALQEVSGP